MKIRGIFFALLTTTTLLSAQNYKPITLEDIWEKGTFSPRGISSINSMQDGEHYCILTRTGVEKYSYRTGEKIETVCSFSSYNKKHAATLPVMQSYTFDKAEQQILFSCNYEPIYRRSGISDYYIYNVSAGIFTKISQEGKQRLTAFSPDGTHTAFVRDNNLYLYDIASSKETPITNDGMMGKVINGTTDWVYEEEFAITRGFYFSPDSRYIAYYRFDESKVKEYSMQMWGNLYPDDYTYKYPKAGEDNSVVDVYIYDVATGKKLKLDVGSQNDQYIPRIKWTSRQGELAVMRMNRLQNKMEILLANAETGALSTLYTEQNDTYVEVPEVLMFLDGGKQFIISSEREGYNSLYLYNMQGTMEARLTGDFDVAAMCGVDQKNKKVYYTAHATSPINTELYVTDFRGRKTTSLSSRPGSYQAYFSTGCKYYISVFSDANTAPIYTLHDSRGKLVNTLQDNAELQAKIKDYGAGRKTFGSFTTSEGVELNYYVILPQNFDSTKSYPLMFYVYGGPGNQQVTNSYGYSDYWWFHMLAQKGYIVACFDGRGTGGRGAEFKKITYRNLGHYECIDAIEAAKYFGSLPYVDAKRIGIFGWSFGGYLSSLSMFKGEGVFRAAIAVAPVTTWRYYDNVYTERFLQRPQDNPAGYDDNSPIKYAHLLSGSYLLVHGTADDNVHVQNALDLVTALETADKQFEFRLYPNKNHSIYGGNTRLNLYKLMTDFLQRKL